MPMNALDPGRALRVRFALPAAPALHVGGARTALFNWLLARKSGGRLVVLIDDARAAADDGAGILRDLRWLGIDWDEGPDIGGPSGPYLTSARRGIYDEHLDRLRHGAPASRHDRAVFASDGAVWLAGPGRAAVDDAIKGRVHLSVDGNVKLREADGSYSKHFMATVDAATL